MAKKRKTTEQKYYEALEKLRKGGKVRNKAKLLKDIQDYENDVKS